MEKEKTYFVEVENCLYMYFNIDTIPKEYLKNNKIYVTVLIHKGNYEKYHIEKIINK